MDDIDDIDDIYDDEDDEGRVARSSPYSEDEATSKHHCSLLPLSEASTSQNLLSLVIDRAAELITRSPREFWHLGANSQP